MPLNVYYLDDEQSICALFSAYINSDLIRVDTFTDADEAIKAANSTPPDIFFIDYRLVGIKGDEVAALTPDNIYKILVTGDQDIKPAYDFKQTIIKPYSLEDIEKILLEYSQNLK